MSDIDAAVKIFSQTSRADEVASLLNAVQDLILPFIASADREWSDRKTEGPVSASEYRERLTLVEQHEPQELSTLLALDLPDNGQSQVGFLEQVQPILKYSVNTWDADFLSKLYASTDAPGLASELLLAALNTNVHTYEVSPVLALVEKHTTRALAKLFGLNGPHAGGISVQGGSASNTTAIVIARNTRFPDTKIHGNTSTGKLVLFTSTHGHYSISKAAQMLGLGSSSVRSVAVDPVTGQMDPSALATSIITAKATGEIPFFLNATAGTTVLGSYDSVPALAAICKEHHLWLHIDASWGGPAIFSSRHKHKLQGSHLADSIAINPHKMMGVPVTCSFLLGADMKLFHKSNTLPANYLFHGDPSETDEVYDLADLTLQCGRRGDALKLYLAWVYHGSQGFAAQIDCAFETAAYLANLVLADPDLLLVSETPPPCTQVCFFYARERHLRNSAEANSHVTKTLAKALVTRGFMIDYAGIDDSGSFLRAVVSRGTGRQTVETLLQSVREEGEKIWARLETSQKQQCH